MVCLQNYLTGLIGFFLEGCLLVGRGEGMALKFIALRWQMFLHLSQALAVIFFRIWIRYFVQLIFFKQVWIYSVCEAFHH